MSDDRIERFKEGVAELDVAAAGGTRDRPLIAVGIVLMLAGPVIAIASYVSAVNLDSILDQNELIILSLGGVAITLVGVAVYLRYSLGRFLRFFLLRQIYEGRVQVDEITEAVRREEER